MPKTALWFSLVAILVSALACSPPPTGERDNNAGAPSRGPVQLGQAFASFPIDQPQVVQFHVYEPFFDKLTQLQTRDQLLDWFLYTIVSDSALDADDSLRTLFDLPPFRKRYLESVAGFEYGEVRSASLGDGQVVALIPEVEKSRRADLLASIADRMRKSRGEIPSTLEIFEYAFDDTLRGGRITRRSPADGDKLFSPEFGYQERRIKSPEDLQAFIGSIDSVSSARIDQQGLVLSGRRFLAQKYRGIGLEEIATLWQAEDSNYALDRAVDAYNKKWGSVSYRTDEELKAIERERAKDLKELERLKKEARPTATCGFSLDPVEGDKVQIARYDCRLAGTEVGMVLFYTDLLAKLWAMDYLGSAPSKDVEDFVPLLVLEVARLYEKELQELPQTRLWFGPRHDGFQYTGDSLLFGRNATRVFAVSSAGSGQQETQANATSAAFIGWWNAHYEQVARFEPEYQRLEELMKWSLIVGWLNFKDASQELGFLRTQDVVRSHWFPTWAASNDRLKFRRWADLGFHPKGFGGFAHESLAVLQSRANRRTVGRMIFENTIRGGVSLGSKQTFTDFAPLSRNVPPAMRRSRFDYGQIPDRGDKLRGIDGVGYEFGRDGDKSFVEITPKRSELLRESDHQLPNRPFSTVLRRRKQRLEAELLAGGRAVGKLIIAKTPQGFTGLAIARHIELSTSIGRAMEEASSAEEEPAAYLSRIPEVLVSVKLPGNEGTLVKLRDGKGSWLHTKSAMTNADMIVGGSTGSWGQGFIDERSVLDTVETAEYLVVHPSQKAPASVYLEVVRNRGPPFSGRQGRPVELAFGTQKVTGFEDPSGGPIYIDRNSIRGLRAGWLGPPSFPANSFGRPGVVVETQGAEVRRIIEGGKVRTQLLLPNVRQSRSASQSQPDGADGVYLGEDSPEHLITNPAAPLLSALPVVFSGSLLENPDIATARPESMLDTVTGERYRLPRMETTTQATLRNVYVMVPLEAED